MPVRHSHCSYCGHPFAVDQPWPRRCQGCSEISYLNPLPVVLAVQPVDDGLLVIRRSIPPQVGWLALPGGFLDLGESWQEATARELREETGLVTSAADVTHFDTLSAPSGTLLVFGLLPTLTLADLPESVANDECDGWELITGPVELAFDLHTAVAARYFATRS
ncbi:ADP-ribose pyrophosphatase YjhB (NUDIX family) [Allocatelliglobosispora scoriae]|uniref:ADP-ribose pyrophosphatase YjhB (NUDIX family) n=1 Tax=Allocatelliglobosispora scoriae TaxID=643052 RepID=A0A841BII6_9ACTN|nr:NUDIX domain-containing protein [Allocatelliglobosispora scoriae]MBB5867138.1 ADP-ribose pyrophosphatase YjhB (NUDIX family) [Allocatelliglobosispora scoriae]